MNRKTISSFILIVALSLFVEIIYSQEVKNKRTSIKQVEISNTEVRELISSKTNRQYFAYVHLPQDYYESDKTYPVLYLTDAESSIFGMYSGIFHLLRVQNEIRDLILVGIAYGGDLQQYRLTRRRDYTPTKVESYPGSGEASEYLRFINENLIPFIDIEYRTDPSNRGLWGSSFGGLFAIYVMLNSPETFQNYIIASPALWWDKRKMLDNARAFVEGEQVLTGNIYTAVGAEEWKRIINDWKEFNELIEKQDYKEYKLISELLQKETHHSTFPLAFTRGLKALYGKTSIALALDKIIKEKGTDEAIKYFYKLKQTDPEAYDFREKTINAFGYKILKDGKITDSIKIFKLNVEAYPNSWNVYDSLGEAYMINGDTTLAIVNYQKSLELNPDNTYGAKMLKRLKKE